MACHRLVDNVLQNQAVNTTLPQQRGRFFLCRSVWLLRAAFVCGGFAEEDFPSPLAIGGFAFGAAVLILR